MPNNSFIVMGQAGPIDLLRGRVWERRRTHTVTIVPKYHPLCVQTGRAANCGTMSLWLYCFFNECCFLHESAAACSPRLSLIISACLYRSGLSPVRSAHVHLPSTAISSSSGYPGYVCVHIGMNCAQNARGPCLFYLVWRVVALQNKRAQVEAFLCEWASLFIFIGVWK